MTNQPVLSPPLFFPAEPLERPEQRKKNFRQRFILQTRNDRGHVISLGTFDREIRPEEAVQQFGERPYTLKSVSPRFKVSWKYKPTEDVATREDTEKELRADLEKLNHRTKIHSYGLVGLGIVSAAGFGLSHLRFSGLEARIARLESIARTLPAVNLSCPNCGTRLTYMLQPTCNVCQVELTWPEKLPSSNPL